MTKRHEPKPLVNDRIDWNLLRTFLVIAEERSISRAAARLHVTQSAVSQALKRLEQNLHRRLIERHGRQFEITTDGEEVRGVADLMYGNLSRLESDSGKGMNAPSGSVRLLTASRVHSYVYDSFLADFHDRYPRIELHIEVMKSSDIVAALLAKTATAGLALCPTSIKKLEKRLFLRQRYAMYCGRNHVLFGKTSIQSNELLTENFVSFTSDAIGAGLSPLTIFRDQNGFTGRIVATSSNHDEIKRLIFAGYGIGFLPEHSVIEDVTSNRLRRLPPAEGVADVDLYFLWNATKQRSPAERAFLDGFEKFTEQFSLSQRLATTPD